jgi:predicted GIY-YIG superfamily endonuclease
MSIKRFNLPPPADFRHGYIYVIEFSNGMVKVGQTTSPASRTRSHSAYAKTLGAAIVQVWFSEEHKDYLASEERLKRAMAAISADRHRDEYFTGVPFEQARGIAEAVFTNRHRRIVGLAWDTMRAGDREGSIALLLNAGLLAETATEYVDALLESLACDSRAAA